MNHVPWSQDTYLQTFHFAAVAHIGQLVPGTEISYLAHITIVAMEVIAALRHEPGHDEDLAVQCALLHDTVEDTAVTYEQVLAEFGHTVAEGVLALTKNPDIAKPAAMADSLQRIREQPAEVWMVKLADRICNLQPPPHYWSAEKRAAYREEARQILAALGDASPYLAARLQTKIDGYAAYLVPAE